jgi:LmbE family N-acetylglucosaminyl deacetylase
MKLRIDFRPSIVVMLLALAALLSWAATCLVWLALPVALFYSLLLLLGVTALVRIAQLERWMDWNEPGRLLILAPHEDDCVIAAGGLGFRNARLGGATRIVYLARDETPGLPERRAAEARTAWRIAGLGEADLVFLDLMPPLERRDPARLRAAETALRGIIDGFEPTAIVMPAFEGGHIHHDMTAALVWRIVSPADRVALFEAPEYTPYVSVMNTPHRVLSLAARWLLGLVSYNGPPDGVDGRPVLKVRLTPEETDAKRRMLAAFESQNAPSLVATRSYPDRLVLDDAARRRSRPFDLDRSYLRFVLALRRCLPARLVDRCLPVQLGTIGRMGTITDWNEEWTERRP